MSSVLAVRAIEFIEESEKVTGPRNSMYWTLKLAEEAGEAVKAYNRFSGLSRRNGSKVDVAKELGDVIYCAYILAAKLGIDLDEAATENFEHVMTRGFKE